MSHQPSPSYSITLRLEIDNRIGKFAQIATVLSLAGGDLGSVDIVRVEKGKIIRDVTVNARDAEHEKAIVHAIKEIEGHQGASGSWTGPFLPTRAARSRSITRSRSKTGQTSQRSIRRALPASAWISMNIKSMRTNIRSKGNAVAVITDGTAVLGLGDIGPEAAMPVMEGKAMLFKEFGGIDAFPIALNTKRH